MKKLMRNFIYNVSFLAVVWILSGCAPQMWSRGQSAEIKPIVIMTWNVHNLFDGKDDGFEYAEFLQSAGWSHEKYMNRINTISAAIKRLEPLPDIILLQEIENHLILEDLTLAMPRGYSWSHFANNPGGIGLGILSRIPLDDVRTHSITVGGITTPRPVLETRVLTEQGDFIIMVCHWKSKVGGVDVTEYNRRASARTILRRVQEIWESEPKLGIIIAGDLNVCHDDFFRRGMNVICSLLPDDPVCVEFVNSLGIEQKDFIVISGNKPPLPVYFSDETVVFYSPWINELDNGSYLYRNNWETIDHFLVSGQFFETSNWLYDKTQVLDFEPFAGHQGTPVPYNPRTGMGLSDHLPLLLTLIVKN